MTKKVRKKARVDVFEKIAIYQNEILRKVYEMLAIAKTMHRERHAFSLRHGMKVCDKNLESIRPQGQHSK